MEKLRGRVEPLPVITKEAQVCLLSNDKEYLIAHKGVGIDIVDYIGEELEIVATTIQSVLDEETSLLLVRSYSFVNE